jgi:hypothetical protein
MTKRFTDDSARTFDTDESRDDALDSIAPETTAEPGTLAAPTCSAGAPRRSATRPTISSQRILN